MSTATAGRHREYQVRDHLIDHGYPHIMRAAASKGPADLLHANPGWAPLLIQVGNHKKTLNQLERNRFVDAAEMCIALPILASVHAQPGHPTRITYWHVTRNQPRTWQPWTP